MRLESIIVAWIIGLEQLCRVAACLPLPRAVPGCPLEDDFVPCAGCANSSCKGVVSLNPLECGLFVGLVHEIKPNIRVIFVAGGDLSPKVGEPCVGDADGARQSRVAG